MIQNQKNSLFFLSSSSTSLLFLGRVIKNCSFKAAPAEAAQEAAPQSADAERD